MSISCLKNPRSWFDFLSCFHFNLYLDKWRYKLEKNSQNANVFYAIVCMLKK